MDKLRPFTIVENSVMSNALRCVVIDLCICYSLRKALLSCQTFETTNQIELNTHHIQGIGGHIWPNTFCT